MTSLDKIAGANGCIFIDDTSNHTDDFSVILPNADTVFSVLSGTDENGDAVNYLTTIALSGATVTKGIPVTIPNGHTITSLTLTSGSVMAYLK